MDDAYIENAKREQAQGEKILNEKAKLLAVALVPFLLAVCGGYGMFAHVPALFWMPFAVVIMFAAMLLDIQESRETGPFLPLWFYREACVFSLLSCGVLGFFYLSRLPLA